MRAKAKALLSCMLVLATLVVSQIAFLAPASADEFTQVDVQVDSGSSRSSYFEGGQVDSTWVSVCVVSEGSISSVTLETQATNFDVTSFSVNDPNTDPNINATDAGSISAEGVWTGRIDFNQCIVLSVLGDVTGAIGDDVEFSVNILSSLLLDTTANDDILPYNDSTSFSFPIVEPVYEVDLHPYVGVGGDTPETVWDGYVPGYFWMNVCASGTGTIKSFQLDVTTSGWINTSFEVLDPVTNFYSNQDVIDPGSITSGGLWTGQLQAGQCLNLRAYGTVSGQIGDTASWDLDAHSGVLLNDSVNVDPNPGNNTNSMITPIEEPVYEVDLNVFVGNNSQAFPHEGTFSNTWIHICTNGYGSVERIAFDIDAVNWTPEQIRVDPNQDEWSTPTDMGTIGLDGVWTGQIDAGQCMVIQEQGPVTGNIGDTVSWTVSILSSDLLGGEENVEPDMTNQTMSISAPIAETGDLAIQTRLLPEDETGEGADLSYEVEIQNVGAGVILDSDVGLYYILPEGATLIGIDDLDPQDDLSPIGCSSLGPVADLGPAFSLYEGEVIACQMNGPDAGIVPGSSYPLRLNLESDGGPTEVFGVVLSGNIEESDSATFVMEFGAGRDGFKINSNNIMHLNYDPDDLQVTINRCEGQAEETSVDNACFTVEFSKPVWAASFEQSDLLLVGGGFITSFEMISTTQWTVRISGMTPGGTIQLLLGVASVADYSAIQNGVSVLGENTVRYAAIGESSTEENAGTGSTKAKSSSGGSNGAAASTEEIVAAAKELISLGAASGLVAEIPEIFSAQLDKVKLLLGSWSIMKSNVLDFSFLIVNVSGAMALILILRNRRRKLA